MSLPPFSFFAFDTHELNDENFDRALACLPVEEHKDVLRYKFAKDRGLALGSRLLRRYYATKVLRIAPDKVVFETQALGKPILRHPRGQWVDFNVSHDGHWVILGGTVQPNHHVGVDVVDMDQATLTSTSVDEWISCFDAQLTEEERQLLKRCGGEAKSRTFFQIWALKESYIKATGEGLSLDIGRLSLQSMQCKVGWTSRGPSCPGAATCKWQISLHGKPQLGWSVYLGYLDARSIVAVSLDHGDHGATGAEKRACVHGGEYDEKSASNHSRLPPSQAFLGDDFVSASPLFVSVPLLQLTAFHT
ncbi:hypothetical protein BC940DRAFT_292055 [Gongronella butleri]|nr:hypothetical protein BC940DRAFT_292055 [Gongronella butleri]